jgi:hypothetical protein
MLYSMKDSETVTRVLDERTVGRATANASFLRAGENVCRIPPAKEGAGTTVIIIKMVIRTFLEIGISLEETISGGDYQLPSSLLGILGNLFRRSA